MTAPVRTGGGAAAYLREEVLTATPLRLVVRVLAGAIAACDRARAAAETERAIDWRRDLGKAQVLVAELYGAVDAEQGGVIAAKLQALYQFVLSRLLIAGARPSPARARQAAHVLSQIKLGFEQLVARESDDAPRP